MNRQAAPEPTIPKPVPRVPAWALPRGPVETDVEAAYLAGGALTALDVLVRAGAPWLGAWRHRLALKAAAATVKLLRRPEDEAALRDAWMLRSADGDPGPAGSILAHGGSWRRGSRAWPVKSTGARANSWR